MWKHLRTCVRHAMPLVIMKKDAKKRQFKLVRQTAMGQWHIQRWSQGGFPSHTFKWLLKVSASKGVIRVDLKKSWSEGGGVSGQPENPPGYATVGVLMLCD